MEQNADRRSVAGNRRKIAVEASAETIFRCGGRNGEGGYFQIGFAAFEAMMANLEIWGGDV